MAANYTRFQDIRQAALNNWIRNFVLPYGSAYSTAYDNYQKTLRLQQEADKAARERDVALAMFALSLCGGSLLTAVFGQAALKTAATELALDVVCRNNMNKAFNVMVFVDGNKTAQFVLGELWDQGGSIFSNQFKATLQETPANFPTLGKFSQMPQNMQNNLEEWVRNLFDKVMQAGIEIDDNISDDKKKEDALRKLMNSYFFKAAPTSRIDEVNVARDIELSFYMKFILELDYLESGLWVNCEKRMVRQVESRQPVTQSPTGTNYPAQSQVNTSGPFVRFKEVKYNDVGDHIEKRIDDLHQKQFGGEAFFFKKYTMMYLVESREDISRQVLVRAEYVLKRLGLRQLAGVKKLGNI